jgi:transposase-like protein
MYLTKQPAEGITTMNDITAPRFTNADKAREHLEALRWPDGPFCPHCGSFKATRLPPVRGKASKKNPEGKTRFGIIQCNDCREQYSVIVGTLFEASKVPLHKWLLCNHLLVSSKKGISAHQIHRMLGVTYKTAWFMCHRLRAAMDQDQGPMGGEGIGIEADETFFGKDKNAAPSRMPIRSMNKIVSLVDRSTGRAKSFVVTDALNAETVAHILYTKTAPARSTPTKRCTMSAPVANSPRTTASTIRRKSTSATARRRLRRTRLKAFSAFSSVG